MTRSWLLPVLALSCPASGYETDQLFDRHVPLEDVTAVVEARVDEVLATTLQRVNRKTRCEGDDDTVRRALAHEIHEETGVVHPIWSRGLIRSQGYHRFDAWMETSVPGRYFHRGEGLYGDVRLFESFIMHTAGSSSTFHLAGQLVGSDKVAHFFDLGYAYFRWSRGGLDPDRGVRRGTETERTIYGMFTSNAFSYADLAANYDGYLFFDGLLREGSVLQRDPAGCVVQVRAFRWAEWVDAEWDEVENPAMYTRKLQRAVSRRLVEEKDDVCASYAQWRDPEYPKRLESTLSSRPPYVRGLAPVRQDPFQLEALCNGEVADVNGVARRKGGAAWYED